jgi:RecA-family ATPase
MSAMAQTDMSNDSSMKKDHMSGKKTMSMTGCIAEKDGKYMMTNQEHPDGVQLMSSEDLKPHVGHQVKVTGMMENMSGASMKSDDKMAGGDNMKHDTMAMMGMKVSSMKMMSAHCSK